MKTSSEQKTLELYESSADWYDDLMEKEIGLPVYADTLGRLAERLSDVSGPLIDTSCGTGHMLSMYGERYDTERSLIGVDFSPRMVAIAQSRLGSRGKIVEGDMRDLGRIEPNSSAAVLSFFALHHLDPDQVSVALREWCRVLCQGGQLVLAVWEGSGPIDYGEESDLVALRYGQEELVGWTEAAGFVVDRCVVEPVEGMPMDAVYLEGTKK